MRLGGVHLEDQAGDNKDLIIKVRNEGEEMDDEITRRETATHFPPHSLHLLLKPS